MRAVAWLGVALVGWSLNLRWGSEQYLGNGPPANYHKHVVGALLLGFLAALALSVSRKLPARLIAVAAALGAVAIAVVVKLRALESVTSGTGWLWMMAGAAGVALATASALAVKAPAAKPRSPHRR